MICARTVSAQLRGIKELECQLKPFERILTTAKTLALLLHQHGVRTLPIVSNSPLSTPPLKPKARINRAHFQNGDFEMVAFQIFGAVMVLLSLGTMMSNDLRQRH